jgi:hypothetical protein
VLAFADGAVLFAGAVLLRLVAHHANDGTGHGSLQGKLYLSMATRGKASLCAVMSTIYSLSQVGLRLSNALARKILTASGPSLTRIEAHASIDFLP